MEMKPLVPTPTGPTAGCLATVVASIGLAVFFPSPAAAQSTVCGTAVLMDVEVVTARVPQTTITSVHQRNNKGKKPGERDVDAYTTPAERQTKTYLVTVRLNDLVYRSEASGSNFWNFDPTGLVSMTPLRPASPRTPCASGDPTANTTRRRSSVWSGMSRTSRRRQARTGEQRQLAGTL